MNDLFTHEFTAFANRLDDSELLRNTGLSPAEMAPAAWDLLEAFQTFVTEHIEESAQMVESIEANVEDTSDPQYEQELNGTRATLQYWELEHQTWELFGALVSERLVPGVGERALPRQLAKDKFACDARIRAHFFETDPSYREMTIILEWLRRYAPQPSADEIEHDSNYRGNSGWMYTKEKIKAGKRLGRGKQLSLLGGTAINAFLPAGATQNTVTELDPDAPSRQDRRLEEEDEAWEHYLMKLLWKFLRKGLFDDAKELCEDAGEFWRAASLGGGEDAWDPKIDGVREDKDGVDLRVKGNRRRELWKRMCYALAHQKGGDEYEKAVYGVLCGDVESVLPVCRTWEDMLFTHVNALVEGYYSTKLAEYSRTPATVSQFPYFDAIAYHSRAGVKHNHIMTRIVDEISFHESVQDSMVPLRTIQGSLISLRFPQVVEELARQLQVFADYPEYDPAVDPELSRGLDATDARTLRVAVHILVILQALGSGGEPGSQFHSAGETLIAGYISTLGEFNKFELIPLYASRLSPEKAIATVGKVLVKFEGDDNDRAELINAMRLHDINVDGCLKETMELTLKLTDPKYETSVVDSGLVFKGFTGELQQEDLQLIRGLEWLLLGSEALQGDRIRMACEVYKRFLVTGRLSAAKELYSKVRYDQIKATSPPVDIMEAEEQIDIHDSADVNLISAAYVHFEYLIQAMIALAKWRDEINARSERQDRGFTRKLMPHYAEVTESLFRVVDLFLDDVQFLATPAASKIREIYIPEMVLALHQVHLEAGNLMGKKHYMNALELANVVAHPDKHILDAFRTSGRLAEYVDAIAAVSRKILGASKEGKDRDLGIWTVAK
ncbi:nuclear pore protein 84/107 [Sphaerosporella brunnea]|uniref:Nuclear pore complex protein n=1 Tax=Sphaerosporella brunnea TaxID=1250544 RepID=A0A5J5EGM4_9PEZI|nr:nuclear pore protein 84/107 [Sphaerosporella brunnea]